MFTTLVLRVIIQGRINQMKQCSSNNNNKYYCNPPLGYSYGKLLDIYGNFIFT